MPPATPASTQEGDNSAGRALEGPPWPRLPLAGRWAPARGATSCKKGGDTSPSPGLRGASHPPPLGARRRIDSPFCRRQGPREAPRHGRPEEARCWQEADTGTKGLCRPSALYSAGHRRCYRQYLLPLRPLHGGGRVEQLHGGEEGSGSAAGLSMRAIDKGWGVSHGFARVSWLAHDR